MIEITFVDGRVRTITPQYYTSAEPFGDCCMAEFDIRLDDLSEGLRLEVSHHGDSSGRRDDGAFDLPVLCRDVSLLLVEREELCSVARICWEGRTVAARVGGELVSMSRIEALGEAYGPISASMPLLAEMGRLADAMKSSAAWRASLPAGVEPADVDEALASAMGVSAGLLVLADAAWAQEADPYGPIERGVRDEKTE